MDYYLKFPDQSTADTALGKTENAGPEGQTYVTYTAVLGLSLDIVGIIYEQTGQEQTSDGMIVPVMSPLPGWHVNLRGEYLPVGLEQYIVNPANPRRVWA